RRLERSGFDPEAPSKAAPDPGDEARLQLALLEVELEQGIIGGVVSRPWHPLAAVRAQELKKLVQRHLHRRPAGQPEETVPVGASTPTALGSETTAKIAFRSLGERSGRRLWAAQSAIRRLHWASTSSGKLSRSRKIKMGGRPGARRMASRAVSAQGSPST